jgi:gliding motility-associated-like protein
MNNLLRPRTYFLFFAIFCTLFSLPTRLIGQKCPDRPSFDNGDFVINGGTVITGDGDGDPARQNNMPIIVCPGQPIDLQVQNNAPQSSRFIVVPKSETNHLRITSGLSGTAANTDASGYLQLAVPTTPDYYYLVSVGSSNGTGYYACQVIQVVNLQTPDIAVQVCSGNEVNITWLNTPNNENYENYIIDATGIGTQFRPIASAVATYPTARKIDLVNSGSHDVVITGDTKIKGCPSVYRTTVVTSGTTLFTPTVKNLEYNTTASGYELIVSGQPNTKRNIYIREPNVPFNYSLPPYQVFTSVSTSTSEKIPITLPNPSKQYCFRVVVEDACSVPNTVPNAALISNQEICSTPFSVVPNNGKNTLIWGQAQTGLSGNNVFNDYEITRTDQFGNVDVIPITNINTTQIDDNNNLVCGVKYTYSIRTRYNYSAFAAPIEVTAMSNVKPPSVDNIFTSVLTNNGVSKIRVTSSFNTIQPVGISGYNFYRADSFTGTYSKITQQNTDYYDDPTANPSDAQYCYYITWQGTCGESEPSNKVCTVFTQVRNAQLYWTKEMPFSGAINSYSVYRIDPTTGSPIVTAGSGLPFTTSNTNLDLQSLNIPEADGQDIYLVIEAFPTTSTLPSSLSNYVLYQRPSLVVSAQAFSPNGDGINDTFYVQGRFIKEIKMKIYDRWGNIVFYTETNDYQSNPKIGWDGTKENGQKVGVGAYPYQIEVEDISGNKIHKEGTITVIY